VWLSQKSTHSGPYFSYGHGMLPAHVLRQCCSHKRESACSWDMSTLASACITTWKPPTWLHKTIHYNTQLLTQQQWQASIWNISRYLNDTRNFSEKNSTLSNWKSKFNFDDLNNTLNTITTSHWNQYFTSFQGVRGMPASTGVGINQISNETKSNMLAQIWPRWTNV